jgi:Domain of unknown function (DUF4410)
MELDGTKIGDLSHATALRCVAVVTILTGAGPVLRALNVRGDFTDVNLSNKTKRMIIGFGRDASDVKAHVVASLIGAEGPIVLAEFELRSQSGKKPGAAATMGIGGAAASVAASGAMDGKAAVERDTARMAKADCETDWSHYDHDAMDPSGSRGKKED